jgi:hypothetical protein
MDGIEERLLRQELAACHAALKVVSDLAELRRKPRHLLCNYELVELTQTEARAAEASKDLASAMLQSLLYTPLQVSSVMGPRLQPVTNPCGPQFYDTHADEVKP